jgi:ferredoxin
MILDYFIHKLTEENPPEINKGKCINSCSKTIECIICKETCPEHAVSIDDKSVSFDKNLCTECGMQNAPLKP